MDPGISPHFRREAVLMLLFAVAALVVGVLAALVVPEVREFFAQDRCLDRGGAFNQVTHRCEMPK